MRKTTITTLITFIYNDSYFHFKKESERERGEEIKQFSFVFNFNLLYFSLFSIRLSNNIRRIKLFTQTLLRVYVCVCIYKI